MEILITVKAYPVLSTRYFETVCVAGIRIDTGSPQLVRLFPVPFRDLEKDLQFSKYDVVEVQVRRHLEDARMESWRPDLSTLRVVGHLGTRDGWAERARWVAPLVAPSLCQIKRDAEAGGPSLGVFRPARITDFRLRPAADRTGRQELIASQMNLFDPERKAIEALPYRFCYRFTCDDPDCAGHEMGLVDWEAGQSYLNFRAKYSSEQLVAKLRQTWLDTACGPDRDPHLFVGNLHRHPKTWLLGAVFYPRTGVMARPVQDALF